MAQIYQDIDIFGEENFNGTPKEYFDKDALKNSLTMWLMTKRGDFVDAPLEGGILDSYTFRNLTDENEEKLRFKLESSLALYFSDVLTVQNIEIINNPTQRFTEIIISYRDLLNGENSEVSVYPTEFTKKVVVKYEYVAFESETLFNFVKLKKPDMLGLKLVFSIDMNKWIWGNRLVFDNFDFSDPYFDEILEYINVL